MKIEIVVLFAIICVSAAEFNNTTTAIPITKNKRPQFVTIHYNATESQQECSLTVLKFPGKYLRYAKAPNLLAYNNVTNFKACQKRCCYEKSFKCISLSYFRPLHQCFLMNVTRHDEGVILADAGNMVHLQTLTEYDFMTTESPEEQTTEMFINSTTEAATVGGKDPTTISQDETTTKSTVTIVDETEEYAIDEIESTSISDDESITTGATGAPGKDGSVKDNPTGVLSGSPSAEKLIARDCSVNCSDNGFCIKKTTETTTENEYVCDCNKGFDGKYCETEIVEEGGLAVWIIVVIVIAILILILIIVALVLLRLYKQKGEYRVVDYFRIWTRRQKKPKKPDNPNEIAHMEDSNEAFPPNARTLPRHEDSTRTAV